MARETKLEELPEFRTAVLSKLNDFRQEGTFCDVTLVVQEEKFTCHRAVLASASEYFSVMFGGNFAESRTEEITLHDVDVASFKVLLDFIYTGSLVRVKDRHKLCNLLQTSSIFNVTVLENQCVEHLLECYGEWETEEIIELFIFACSINNENLLKGMSEGYLAKYFNYISYWDNFLKIPFHGLNLILKGFTERDPSKEYLLSLKFRDEDHMLDVLIRWVNHNLEERKSYFEKLSAWICFENISVEYDQFLSKEYSISCNTSARWKDKLLLKKSIGNYFELKSNANVESGSVIPKPISFESTREKVDFTVYITLSFDPSSVYLFQTDKDKCRWYQRSKINIDDYLLGNDIGNVAFSKPDDRLYSLVGQKFLLSYSANWSLGSECLLQYPPGRFNSFDMCGVEKHNSIYLYNADVYQEPITKNMSAFNSSRPAFSLEEICRGIYCYNCELDKWLPVPRMKRKLAESCIVADANLVYVIGGFDRNGRTPKGYMQAYDNRMKDWLQLPKTEECYDDHFQCCASIFDGEVCISNGHKTEFYDPIANKWRKIQSTSLCNDHLYWYGYRSYMTSFERCLWFISSDNKLKSKRWPETHDCYCCTSIINPYDGTSEMKWQKSEALNACIDDYCLDLPSHENFSLRIINVIVF